MKYEVKIVKTAKSRLGSVDFDNLIFGRTMSDHMFMADYIDGQWTNLQIVPFGPIPMAPSMMALHYGQSIFEGMKATKDKDGTPLLFRPEMHAHRLNASARRMCMPELPADLFLESLHLLVGMDADWIPPKEGSALYLRPFMFATDEFLGVRPSNTYKYVVITSPVGPYYAKPVRLHVETEYVRAVKGGVGEAKVAGNYAASLLPAKLAQAKGFDQVMWMDANKFKEIQEVGTMNLFFVIGDKVVTPATDGAILKGITRDTFITLLRDRGVEVEERVITITEIVAAHRKGLLKEVFGAGTAAVSAPVSEFSYKDKLYKLPEPGPQSLGNQLKSAINGIRVGTVADKHNWLVPVQVPATV